MVGFTELPPPPGTRFRTVRLVAETGSTNADVAGEAAAGAPEGLVLVADHQSAGRGRQRRVWHDEPGASLLLSVLLRPRRELATLIPLVAGLAALDAVAGSLGRPVDHPVEGPDRAPLAGLKWPNDVLAPTHGERKLAGILAEATTPPGAADDRRLPVIVGMGMNLRPGAAGPEGISSRAVTLAELVGGPVERDAVLGHFLVGLERWLTCLETGGPALDAYRAACLTLGREVRFTTADGEHRGRAVDVTPTGTLLLETAAGIVELHAGDAHHVGAADDRSDRRHPSA